MKGVSSLILIAVIALLAGGFFVFQKSQTSSNSITIPKIQFPSFSNTPSCGNSTLFTVSPVSLSDIVSLAPLGQMSPPDHVFPAPHLYFYVIDFNNPKDIEIPVYATGNMTLTQIGLRHYNKLGQYTDYIDYTLVFSVCSDYDLYFHHVRSLKYQPFIDAAQKLLPTCNFSKDRNEDFCSGQVNIPVKAGELIGTAGDLKGGVWGLDVGARDYRLSDGRSSFANPDHFCRANEKNTYGRCYTVCALDYLPQNIRSQFRFSDNSNNTRTQEPTCGDVLHLDVKNTAQGYWFLKGPPKSNFSPESDNLYLGPDFVKPVKVFSVGLSIPSFNAGKYEFQPSSGSVNKDFSNVTVDGNVYCYQTSFNNNAQQFIILIQLTTSTTLRIEKQTATSCSSGPWTFGLNYADFER